MKIVCSKDHLLKSLNMVSRAVPVRTTMDILKCILLKADTEGLTLTANDTTLGIETFTEASVQESGRVAVDAALFTSIIRKLPDSDITIAADENDGVDITCEKAKFHIAGRGTDDFVMLPDVDTSYSIACSEFMVREMINQVIFSIAESEVNAAMSGVYVEIFDNHLRMTTLDGHRISVRVAELKDSYPSNHAIVPGKTFSDLSKILGGDNEAVIRLSFSKNHIVFEFGSTRMVSRLIDGEYFKIASMLKEEHECTVKINKRILLDCLDRSTLFVNEGDKKPVIMDIRDQEMNLRLKSGIGSMNETIYIEKQGIDLKIAFNPKLMIDALRVIDDEEITMYMVKYNYPCTIRNEEGTYTYVVLPVNFTEE